jgi:hypothetical protein
MAVIRPSNFTMDITLFDERPADVARSFQDTLDPRWFAAVLSKSCERFAATPSSLILLPCYHGSFRHSSCLALLSHPLLPTLVPAAFIPHLSVAASPDQPSHLPGSLHAYTTLPVTTSTETSSNALNTALSSACRIFDAVEYQQRLSGKQMSRKLRYANTAHDALNYFSTDLFRSVMAACKAFHEGNVWDRVGTDAVFTVTLPSGVIVYCVVCGKSDYSGRGAYFYTSLSAAISHWSLPAPGAAPKVCSFVCLGFVDNECLPFTELNHIIELGVPLAANEANNETYPLWYAKHGSLMPSQEEIDDVSVMWKKKPRPMRFWECAATLYAVMASLKDGSEAQDGAQSVVAVDEMVGEDPLKCSVGVFKIRPGCTEEEEELAAVGGPDDHCSFCAYPRNRTTSQKLAICTACKSIWYCGGACQKLDWTRHKVECKLRWAAAAATKKAAEEADAGAN